MKHNLLHILTLLFASVLLTNCVTEMDDLRPVNSRGSFTLGLSTDSLAVEVETRAGRDLTDAEKGIYTVSLVQEDETIWIMPFANIKLEDRTQPTGQGYVVSAESCTATEAESANSGWGQRRYWGKSETFDIKANENTDVSVDCSMANAGLCVDFEESFTSFFTEGYTVTIVDSRNLEFNKNTTGSVAYYNVGSDGTHDVRLLINASAGWDGMLKTIDRTLTLRQGHTYCLHVRKGAVETGTMGVTITTEDFVEGESEEVIVE
jgi:hypothetical protein